MIQNEIYEIVDFCSQIISEGKIGSRYESNDVQKIWRLGDIIISKITPLNVNSLLPKLQKAHELKKIRYDVRLYKAAIAFRKYWEQEPTYKEVIKNLNVWGKLRELHPIIERVINDESEHSRQEIEKLITQCKEKTYTEVREIFKRFRRADDKILEELDIDIYEFSELMVNLSEKLKKAIDEDSNLESDLRKIYSPEQIKDFRLLLSALQKEDVYINKKWNAEIKKIVRKHFPEATIDISKDINQVYEMVKKVIINDKARRAVRKEVPIMFIGNLATYLRALESEVNKSQYKKDKEILNKFLGNIGS